MRGICLLFVLYTSLALIVMLAGVPAVHDNIIIRASEPRLCKKIT